MHQGKEAGIAKVLITDGPVQDGTTGRLVSHAGMGIVVGRCHVLTCAHVVNTAVGLPVDSAAQPDRPVRVMFPFSANARPVEGKVVAWHPMSAKPLGDVAVIELNAGIPEDIRVAAFCHTDRTFNNHPLTVFGFRAGNEEGNYVEAKFMGPTSAGRVQIDGVKVTGVFIEKGYSGAAVWDPFQEAVVGMVSATNASLADRVAYMVPAVDLEKAWHLTVVPSVTKFDRFYPVGTGAGQPEGLATIRDIVPRLIPYFQEIDRLHQESECSALHIPLDCVTESQQTVPVDHYVNSWLQDNSKRHLALLGDYGTGKTWLCIRLAKKLLDRFRSDPGLCPLPLLINFRRYQPDTDCLSLLRSALLDGYGVSFDDAAAVTRLLKSPDVILMLDGLDEMAKKQGDRSAILSYYRLGLPATGPKVIVTCRTNYFYNGTEQREVINSDKKVLSIAKVVAFDVIHLKMLDRPQILEGVRVRFNDASRPAVIQFIDTTYNLGELCARPVLFDLVCKSFGLLPGIPGPVTSAALYDEYFRAWLRREYMDGRLALEPDNVTMIMEDLAHHMVTRSTLFLTPDELQLVLSDVLARAGIRVEGWRELHRQLLTSTFLRRSAPDSWEFAHRSFQEFFYARKFFRWEAQTGGRGEFPVVHVPIWQFVAQLVLRSWDEAKAFWWIPRRIDRDNEPSLTLTTLRAAAAYWLLKRSASSARDYPLTDIMLDSVDLRGIDFSGCNLSSADFHRSDLCGASFEGAEICDAVCDSANLDDCNLVNARAVRADLRGASLLNTDLRHADLTKANLKGSCCCGASLEAANLDGANIGEANFRGASFGTAGSAAWLASIGQLRVCPGVATAHFDESIATALGLKPGGA
jgi:hypothetical protein